MKIELHSHSEHSSHCGKVPAEQAAQMFADAGYDVVVCTDHYNPYNVDCFPGTPVEKAREWLKGYEQIYIKRLQVFADTTTDQDLEMIPLSELPNQWDKSETFDTPPQHL